MYQIILNSETARMTYPLQRGQMTDDLRDTLDLVLLSNEVPPPESVPHCRAGLDYSEAMMILASSAAAEAALNAGFTNWALRVGERFCRDANGIVGSPATL
jgi:hypothetical protein